LGLHSRVAKPVKLSTLAVKHDVQVVLNPTCTPSLFVSKMGAYAWAAFQV